MEAETTVALRCATAGSVDDGKSTLIGRLLLDSKSLLADQIAHVAEASRRRGLERADLALVTDGLRAEREQGITIDVAWRYFATPRRRFVLADSPGHVQYTRNTVTACSSADAAVILVDARRGLSEQTKRHLFVARLVAVPHVVIAVNKMDAVLWDLSAFARVRDDVAEYLGALPAWLPGATTTFIPLSALTGDNVVEPSRTMPWYDGPTLLAHLEGCEARAESGGPARLSVQWVIRPQSDAHPDYRGYAGRLASGTLRVGQAVKLLPSGESSRVTRIETARGDADEARAGESIVVHLEGDFDVGRGESIIGIASGEPEPRVTRELSLHVAWVHKTPAKVGATLWVKHGSREVRGVLESIDERYDVATGASVQDDAPFGLNALGRVRVRTNEPLVVESFATSRVTGSALLVDAATGDTLAGAMIA
ncbi:MAG TPA: GTP-binding protein [Polyangiaceae bacterium]|jgi:sulfate adenylyltransferase large subunit